MDRTNAFGLPASLRPSMNGQSADLIQRPYAAKNRSSQTRLVTDECNLDAKLTHYRNLFLKRYFPLRLTNPNSARGRGSRNDRGNSEPNETYPAPAHPSI